MKNFTKTIASIGLSLVAIGAMAQMQANYSPNQRPTSKPHLLVNPTKSSNTASTNRVAANTVNGFLDYVDGDQVNNAYQFWNGSSGNYTAWSPVLYMNAKYTIADTVTSPFTSGKANVYTANSFTIAYDTMWDNFQQSFRRVGAGSVVIDTMWGIIGYHNTSNQNDTLIFSICQVTSRGMPTATVIRVDTQVIAPHNHAVLPGTSLDSNYVVGFLPVRGPVSILGAQAGWHFCVNVTVHGSKSDTLGFEYYSAFTTCSANAYSDSCTTMGVRNGICPATNSFVTGLYWFNSAAFGGNRSQLTLPVAVPAANAGKWVNSGGQQFYNFTPGGCSGFVFWPGIQNIGLLLSVSYNDVTGVNEVAANNGFSVSQNYPNPFNQNSVINYSLEKESNVMFTVYDMTGRELVNNAYSNLSPGKHSVELNANQFTPGVYLYTFNVNGVKVTKRMVITQ